jgi:hypothetical protein
LALALALDPSLELDLALALDLPALHFCFGFFGFDSSFGFELLPFSSHPIAFYQPQTLEMTGMLLSETKTRTPMIRLEDLTLDGIWTCTPIP